MSLVIAEIVVTLRRPDGAVLGVKRTYQPVEVDYTTDSYGTMVDCALEIADDANDWETVET